MRSLEAKCTGTLNENWDNCGPYCLGHLFFVFTPGHLQRQPFNSLPVIRLLDLMLTPLNTTLWLLP